MSSLLKSGSEYTSRPTSPDAVKPAAGLPNDDALKTSKLPAQVRMPPPVFLLRILAESQCGFELFLELGF